jgi:hypothetical protein
MSEKESKNEKKKVYEYNGAPMTSRECENLNFLICEYGIIEILKYLFFCCKSDYWKKIKNTIDEKKWDKDPTKEYYLHQMKERE